MRGCGVLVRKILAEVWAGKQQTPGGNDRKDGKSKDKNGRSLGEREADS
jgi:hypothetical protein